MHKSRALAVVGGLSALVAAFAGPAGALPVGDHPATGHAVFVQTNDPSGNQVVAYQRDGRGVLHLVGRYDTGGNGIVVPGAVVDPLASQGSLAYDAALHELIAVNAGSDTVSAFRVDGASLRLERTVPSGGTTPVSVTVEGDRLYVLNAGGSGTVQGFSPATLAEIPDSTRDLGLDGSATPRFLHTPGQVGLTPDGHHLVVTTKASASSIDVFGVSSSGSLSATPTTTVSATPVPFGFTFDGAGDLVATEALTSHLSTYTIETDGTLQLLGTVGDGQAALCWVASTGRYFYGANAGSGSVTGFTIGDGGAPAVVGTTSTDAGPIDLAATPDGSAVYVETGGSDLVDAFAVGADGALGFLGSVAPELPGHSGLEGIVVT